MMQTFTKTEIRWVIDALRHDMEYTERLRLTSIDGSLSQELAELRYNNLNAILHKFTSVLEDDAKRIAVK